MQLLSGGQRLTVDVSGYYKPKITMFVVMWNPKIATIGFHFFRLPKPLCFWCLLASHSTLLINTNASAAGLPHSLPRFRAQAIIAVCDRGCGKSLISAL